MTEMHRKEVDTEVKAVQREQGIVTAVVSVFNNVDAVGDVVLPGAFTRTIADWKSRMVATKPEFLPVLYAHKDSPDMILGKVVALRQTTEGLEVDQQFFLNKPAARDAFDAIQEGVLTKSSFGYGIQKAKPNSKGGLDLAEVSLFDVGPTIKPVNGATRMVAVKAEAEKAVDQSPWDKDKAMGQCSTAADYRSICAGEHTVGEPDQRQHWALPHHYLGKGPNAAGVRNALARLPQTQDLANRSAAESHLNSHMSSISPGKADEERDEKSGREFSAKNLAVMEQAWNLLGELLGKNVPDEEKAADEPQVKADSKSEDEQYPVAAQMRLLFQDAPHADDAAEAVMTGAGTQE